MKKTILLILVCTRMGTVPIEAQTLEWVKNMGGNGYDISAAITADNIGNVYSTGWFEGTCDFDPGTATYNLTASTGYGIHVSKLNASGDFVWAKQFEGTSDGVGEAITTDPAGNVYIAGWFVGTGDFDPGSAIYNLTSSGGRSMFICKLDANGSFVWARDIATIRDGISLSVDNAGNVYTTGYFSGVVDFDPGSATYNLTSNGSNDIFICKLDVNGNFVWAKNIGSTGADVGHSVAVDNIGNVYTTGYFNGVVDFDPGSATYNLTSNGGNDIFICKLDVNGNFVWAKNIGGTGADVGISLALDNSGNVYTTGYFNGVVDFDPGSATYNLTSAGSSSDIFIYALDINGNFVWAKNIGGSNTNSTIYSYTISTDASGNVYTAGYFRDTIDFDPGTGISNLINTEFTPYLFVLKLDINGNYSNSLKISPLTYPTYMHDVLFTDPSGGVYITGNFAGTVDFDPSLDTVNLISNGAEDIFVLKLLGNLDDCRDRSNISITACNEYLFNHTLYTESGTYTDTFKNVNDCDSIVLLYLTILDTVWNYIYDTACDIYSINNEEYANSGVYSQYFTTSGGCDSVLEIHLVINQSYSDTLTYKECDSFRYQGKIYYQSAFYTDTFLTKEGCDSLVTLDLTIGNSYNSTITISACDNFAFNNHTYTKSGSYADTFINSDGCDSITNLNLIINPKPQVSVTQIDKTLIANSADTWQWVKCDNNYTPVKGATGQIFTPEEDGTYAVIVTVRDCKDTSDCYKVSGTTSLAVREDTDIINIYPNPIQEVLHIRTNNPVNVSIYDLQGTQLLRDLFIESTYAIDVNHLSKGVYLLKITNKEGRVIRIEKLVK